MAYLQGYPKGPLGDHCACKPQATGDAAGAFGGLLVFAALFWLGMKLAPPKMPKK